MDLHQQRKLCEKVTQKEIKDALFGIDDDKAPGINGFNACFYRKTWLIIKDDIGRAVQDFFEGNTMLKVVNTTVVTLILKVPQPTTIRELRPIAC